MTLVESSLPRQRTARRHSMQGTTLSPDSCLGEASFSSKPWLEFLDKSTLNLLEESTRSFGSDDFETEKSVETESPKTQSKVVIKNLSKVGSRSMFSSTKRDGSISKTLISVDETLSSTEEPSDSTLSPSDLLSPNWTKASKKKRLSRRFSLSKGLPTIKPIESVDSSIQEQNEKKRRSRASRRHSISRVFKKPNLQKAQRKLLGKMKRSDSAQTSKKSSEKHFYGDDEVVEPNQNAFKTTGSQLTPSDESTITQSSAGSGIHSIDVWLGQIDGTDLNTSWRSVVCEYALNPRRTSPFRLRRKTLLNDDTFVLEFALPTAEHESGLPPGKHVIVSAVIDGKRVLRRYAPISSQLDKGILELLVKAFRPSPLYPAGGKMSQYLDRLEIGDYLDFRGPVGEFEYLSNGDFIIEGVRRTAHQFNMVASSFRIASCMQIIARILCDKSDTTRISLIYLAKDEEDLLMKSRLDKWTEEEGGKFQVHYVLSDKWPRGWKHSTGRPRQSLFAAHFSEPNDYVYNLMSAPPAVLEQYCIPALTALGHARDKQFAF
jgi:cytochrome-b5 reductase